MSTGKVTPALAQGAIRNYCRLPGLSNFYISQFWRLEIYDQALAGRSGVQWGHSFSLSDGRLLTVSLHGGEKGEKASTLIFLLIRALTPLLRTTPTWPNYLPKAKPPTIISLGVRTSTWQFGERGGRTQACSPYTAIQRNSCFRNAVVNLWAKLHNASPPHRRRQWHPTPVLLPGKSHGWRSLVGCSPWGLEESDMTEQLHFHFPLSCTGEGNGNPL